MTDHQSAGIGRVLPALGLLVFAPVAAEYLYGYDDSTGNLEELVGGLFIFAPLYGGAALIIREITRRSRRGWPTMLLLGLAFGLAQAGLIDHSMFNPSYRDISYWEEMFSGTFVPALDMNPNLALSFTTGHMIWSIAAPIAIIEALVARRRTTPWLGNVGLGVTVIGFVLAAAVVIWWHLDTEDFLPSVGQLIGAATTVIALTVAAFTLRHRVRPENERRTVSPWLVGAATLAILGLPTAVEPALEGAGLLRHSEAGWFILEWPGFALELALLATLGVLLVRWSSRRGWKPLHQLAAAGGALLANVGTAFATEPIGNVSATRKYAHNTVALLVVIALIAIAAARRSPGPSNDKGVGARLL